MHKVLSIVLLLASVSLLAGEQKAAAKKTRMPDDTVWVNRPRPGQLPEGVTHHVFHSDALGRDVGYCIYLPPQYTTDQVRRFPVIYNLHGNGGNEVHGAQNATILHKGTESGKWPPMMMVFPNGGLGTFYMDSTDGKLPVETMITKELIPYIDATYRTIADRAHRAIEGFSMGALGSVQLSMKHPELFCSVGGYAGGMQHLKEMFDRRSELNAAYTRMLGDDRSRWAVYDAFVNARKNADAIRGHTAIRLWCGTADDYHLAATRSMHELLTELKIDHDYREFPGLAHNSRKMFSQTEEKLYDFHVAAMKAAAK
jgi:S-formylglutathione hydrolase FrmB